LKKQNEDLTHTFFQFANLEGCSGPLDEEEATALEELGMLLEATTSADPIDLTARESMCANLVQDFNERFQGKR